MNRTSLCHLTKPQKLKPLSTGPASLSKMAWPLSWGRRQCRHLWGPLQSQLFLVSHWFLGFTTLLWFLYMVANRNQIFSGQLLPRSRLQVSDSTKLKRSAVSTVLTAVGPQTLKNLAGNTSKTISRSIEGCRLQIDPSHGSVDGAKSSNIEASKALKPEPWTLRVC